MVRNLTTPGIIEVTDFSPDKSGSRHRRPYGKMTRKSGFIWLWGKGICGYLIMAGDTKTKIEIVFKAGVV
jgi:hypothetical protein